MGRVRCKKKLKAFDPFAPASRKACLGMSGPGAKNKVQMDMPPDMPKKKKRRANKPKETLSKQDKRYERSVLGLGEDEVGDIEVENPFGKKGWDAEVCSAPITGPGVWKPGDPKWSRQGEASDGEDEDINLGEQHVTKAKPSTINLGIKQEPGESLRDYKRRIRSRTSEMLIQHKKDSNQRYQKRKGYMKTKAKDKKARPSGPDSDSDDDLRADRGKRRRDEVHFGDFSERPPEFKFTPKKIGGNKLQQAKPDTFKTKQDVSKGNEMAKLREQAQAAYKAMKAKKMKKFQQPIM